MFRFLLTAVPLLLVLMAVFALSMGVFGLGPDLSDLARHGVKRGDSLPLQVRLGGWVVESLGLTALFLLIQGRSGSWWLDGLVSGLIAWLFRGPVLVLTVVSMSRLPADPWWPMSLRWLALYIACGLSLAIVARRQGLERTG